MKSNISNGSKVSREAGAIHPDYSNNYSQINIKCSNPKIVVFEFIDNRRDSNWAIESGKGHLSTAGLGKTSTGKNIGYYEMVFNTESLSGAPSNLGVSVLNQGSSGWRDVCCSAVSMGISGGQLIGFFDKAASGDSKFEPVAITEQTITFNANVFLQKSAFGGISDSESVDGSLTMALKYI